MDRPGYCALLRRSSSAGAQHPSGGAGAGGDGAVSAALIPFFRKLTVYLRPSNFANRFGRGLFQVRSIPERGFYNMVNMKQLVASAVMVVGVALSGQALASKLADQ